MRTSLLCSTPNLQDQASALQTCRTPRNYKGRLRLDTNAFATRCSAVRLRGELYSVGQSGCVSYLVMTRVRRDGQSPYGGQSSRSLVQRDAVLSGGGEPETLAQGTWLAAAPAPFHRPQSLSDYEENFASQTVVENLNLLTTQKSFRQSSAANSSSWSNQ